MRKPKNISGLMHRFANGYREDCTVGNVSIRSGAVYSYNLPICVEIKGTFVLHYAGNSPTTNSHISELYRAIHGKLIHVPSVRDVETSHVQLLDTINVMLKEASTARTRKESILANLAGKLEDFNKFAELKESEFRFDVAEVVGRNLEQIAAAKKEDQKKLLAEKKAYLAEMKLTLEARLAEWRAGTGQGYTLRDLPCALRLRPGDGASQLSDNLRMVQTSHGAEVPVDAAITLWKLIQRAMKKHNDYEPGLQVGHYRLNKIKANGDVVIGCHDIPYSEMEMIAKELELI